MKAQRLSRFVAVVGIVLAVLVGGLSGGLSGAADPHFSNVTGILGGQRQLLRIDDLVILGASNPLTPLILQTANSSTIALTT